MQYRELGRTGLRVSAVALGKAPLGGLFGAAEEQDALAIVGRALDAGITFFDSSPFYGLAQLGHEQDSPGWGRIHVAGPSALSDRHEGDTHV